MPIKQRPEPSLEPVWEPYGREKRWIRIHGVTNALVRTEPLLDGTFMWQFRGTVGHTASVEHAKEIVEAGAEYFATMKRNPYR